MSDQAKITGENIRRLRKSHGLTGVELAKKIGVASSSVSLWENGLSFPRSSAFVKMSELFGVTLDEIVGTPEKAVEKPTPQPLMREQAKFNAVDIISLLSSPTAVVVNNRILTGEEKDTVNKLIQVHFGLM